MRGRKRGEGKTIIEILRGILLLGEGIIEALILSLILLLTRLILLSRFVGILSSNVEKRMNL